MRLRLLDTAPLDGATNMALDEALLTRARRTRDVTVRVYSWTQPTLSFGRHQTARGVYDPDRAAALGLDVVRRPTGGRAVVHARELTYSVTAPADLFGARASLTATHARITAMIADAVASLGAEVTPAPAAGRARRPDASPCFDAPAVGELVAREDAHHAARKLVGSAQWREDGAFLQHGSILIGDDQDLLGRCTVTPVAPVAPATLTALLGRTPTTDEVGCAVLAAARRLGAELGMHDEPHAERIGRDHADDPMLVDEVARLLPRYRDPTWTWRR